jgi:carbon storage regulator
MLVLSRKESETILIGDNIEVEILKVGGNNVRLGLKAPTTVKIVRGELAPFGLQEHTRAELSLSPAIDVDGDLGLRFEVATNAPLARKP